MYETMYETMYAEAQPPYEGFQRAEVQEAVQDRAIRAIRAIRVK